MGAFILLGYLLYQLFEPFLSASGVGGHLRRIFPFAAQAARSPLRQDGRGLHQHRRRHAHHRRAVRPHRHGVHRRSEADAGLYRPGGRRFARARTRAARVELGAASAIRAGHPESRRRAENGRVADRGAGHRRRRPARAQHRRRGGQRDHHAVRAVLLLPRRRRHHEPSAPRSAVRSFVPRRAHPRNGRAHQSQHQLGHHRGARAGRGRGRHVRDAWTRRSGVLGRHHGVFLAACRLAHGLCGCPSRCGCCSPERSAAAWR